MNFLLSNTVAYILGIVNSYFWNTRWVFKDSNADNTVIKFVIVNIVALAASNTGVLQ
jgi:putative flippase GtrA